MLLLVKGLLPPLMRATQALFLVNLPPVTQPIRQLVSDVAFGNRQISFHKFLGLIIELPRSPARRSSRVPEIYRHQYHFEYTGLNQVIFWMV